MPKITCTYAIEHLCLYSHETLKYIKKEDISANHEYKGDLPEMPKRRRDRSQEVIDEAEGEAKNWKTVIKYYSCFTRNHLERMENLNGKSRKKIEYSWFIKYLAKSYRLRIEKIWSWYLNNCGGGVALSPIYQLGTNGDNRL